MMCCKILEQWVNMNGICSEGRGPIKGEYLQIFVFYTRILP